MPRLLDLGLSSWKHAGGIQRSAFGFPAHVAERPVPFTWGGPGKDP